MKEALLGALLLVVSACSSSASSPGGGSGGVSAGGSSGRTGGSNGGAGGFPNGHDASTVGPADGPSGRPFWCPGYRSDNTGKAPGWVSIDVAVMNRGRGGMTSPIQDCHVGATDWSVSASGTEMDGMDETTMTFRIGSHYAGPGIYSGGSAQDIFASFSHSDLGTYSFSSVPTSECELCINDDGLSGTVFCWGLESPAGAALQTAIIAGGSFTCDGATPKPADAPVTTSKTDITSQGIVCHYAKTLSCADRPADDQCIRHSDTLLVDGPCSAEWSTWLGCIEEQRPSTLQCASADVLKTSTGACDTELAALNSCRSKGGTGGNSGAGGTGGNPNSLANSPECDAFCANMLATCGRSCDRSLDCIVYNCPAATRAFLTCAAKSGALECDANSYLVRNCPDDFSLCK